MYGVREQEYRGAWMREEWCSGTSGTGIQYFLMGRMQRAPTCGGCRCAPRWPSHDQVIVMQRRAQSVHAHVISRPGRHTRE